MTETDRTFLEDLSQAVEDAFPGTVAAFEGFKTAYLGGESDGFLILEVFNAEESAMENILNSAEERTRAHLLAGGGFVTLSLWTPEETAEHFQEDLARIKSCARFRRGSHPNPLGTATTKQISEVMRWQIKSGVSDEKDSTEWAKDSLLSGGILDGVSLVNRNASQVFVKAA